MTVHNAVNNLANSDIGKDAWGRPKTITDLSLFSGMFTFNVPVKKWYESLNGTELTTFSAATSVDGQLRLESGAPSNDLRQLQSFRNPRYQANRGHLYSSALRFPSPTAAGSRIFGVATVEAGVFFELRTDGLYAVVRTTQLGVTTEDDQLIDIGDVDLTKGNVFDIQFQWRGVGNYMFYINQKLVYTFNYLGTLDRLSMYNPALPVCFSCENLGANVVMYCGCVDVTSEGGIKGGLNYDAISVDTDDGGVSVSGLNQPVLALRSKLIVNTLINTRDTLLLSMLGYGDQRCVFRFWRTRDFTAITDNSDTWSDTGDGNLESIQLNNGAATDMTFDTAKAELVFSARTALDTTFLKNMLFDQLTELYLTAGDMFIWTLHRENGGNANVGATVEYGEEI